MNKRVATARRRVKRRPYDASRRREAAARNREAIFAAAKRLFLTRGYAGTTMEEVAAEASVALDTVYASVGPKPALFRLLVEGAISGTDRQVPVMERDYVSAIRATPTPGAKLDVYADAIAAIQRRLAPLFDILRSAAPVDAALAALWDSVQRRRARNMPLLVDELARTGGLREDVSRRDAADLIWAVNSIEVYVLLTKTRRWAHARYAPWLAGTLKRLLLRDSG
jgi:AcrR family transcriptional regulator